MRGIVGGRAEQRAEHYLKQQGLSCLHRNFSCRLGEIDRIMQDKDTVIFVEVRARSSLAYGGSPYSITRKKQQRLIRTAHYYLKRYDQKKQAYPRCRFDVVLIQLSASDQPITWIKDAFTIDYLDDHGSGRCSS